MADLPRIALVDHIRGLAALSVAWFHLTSGSHDWARETGRFGYLGVEAFFVISGLVIPYAIMRAFPNYTLRDYPAFIGRRMIRLEPPYLVSILVVLSLTLLAAQLPQFQGTTEGLLDPRRIGAHLLYLVPLTDFAWLQPVYWTLAFEFAFYLSMGILFPLVARPERLVHFLAIAALCCWAVAFWGLPARVLLFAMGISTFRHVILNEQTRFHLLTVGLSLAVMSYAGQWLEGLVGASVALLLAHHTRVAKLPPGVEKVLAGLGLVSYSLYLIHVPIGGRIVNLGRRFVDSELQVFILSVAALAVSLFAAAIMYRLVEGPSQALARGLAQGRWWKRQSLGRQAV